MEGSAIELADQILDAPSLGGEIGEHDLAARLTQERSQHRQRIRRLRRAEHLFALLAAPLAGEGDAVDERRVDEQGLSAKHHVQRTTVRGMARRARVDSSAAIATGSGESSTLQHRRHTGKIPFSSSLRRIST